MNEGNRSDISLASGAGAVSALCRANVNVLYLVDYGDVGRLPMRQPNSGEREKDRRAVDYTPRSFRRKPEVLLTV